MVEYGVVKVNTSQLRRRSAHADMGSFRRSFQIEYRPWRRGATQVELVLRLPGSHARLMIRGNGIGWRLVFAERPMKRLVSGEILHALEEAQILVAQWRGLHNGLRPHSSLGSKSPAIGGRTIVGEPSE
jgi:transposase InsO family protein